MKERTIEDVVIGRSIVKWDGYAITLDDGTEIWIEETAQDCCASADGEFSNVKLNAFITDVKVIKEESFEDEDWGETTNKIEMVFLHNQGTVAEINARANDGNGGYYFSVASFVVRKDNNKELFALVRA